MTARNRVASRAEQIYTFLRDHQETPYRLPDLLAELGMRDGTTTRSAIKHARLLAEADGLCFPVAVPANGWVYVVTTDPIAVLDPTLHLARIEQGVRTTKERHEDFIRPRLKQMPLSERRVAAAWMNFEDQMRQAQAGAAELTRAMVDMRKDARVEAAAAVDE